LAWRGAPAEVIPPTERLFWPALLDKAEFVFLAGSIGETIVAGAVGSHTDGVVGLSNLFAPPELVEQAWAGAVATLLDTFPGVPLVGYESGDELVRAQRVGFAPIGSLRVWLRATGD
jgi:hypothetical protein